MAKWNCLRLTVTLASDLHCGNRPLGFISRCHAHVPQHIPLYSLVPVMAAKLQLPEEENTYEQLELFCKKHFCFLPFFVHGKNKKVLFPWRKKDLEQLEADFLGSRYGVAVNYQKRAARENHLFEIESILSRCRSTGLQTKLTGYLFCRPGNKNINGREVLLTETNGNYAVNTIPLEELLICSQWGGERNKGLGRLADIHIEKAAHLYEDIPLTPDSDRPGLTWPQDRNAPFPLQFSNEATKIKITGKLIPMTGRRFAPDKGPGLKSSPPLTVWQPGWQAQSPLPLFLEHSCSLITKEPVGND